MRKTIPWTRGERIVRWSVFAGLFVLVAVRREVREEAGMGSELKPRGFCREWFFEIDD